MNNMDGHNPSHCGGTGIQLTKWSNRSDALKVVEAHRFMVAFLTWWIRLDKVYGGSVI